MCLELVLGVKLSTLSASLSGVLGLADSIGTVFLRARPIGGVFGLAVDLLRGPKRMDLGVRRSGVSCLDDDREVLSERVGVGVPLVEIGVELGLKFSLELEPSSVEGQSTSRIVDPTF